MPIEIETSQRMGDWWRDERGQEHPKYHAQVKGRPGLWACGRTQAEAIGDLVHHHPEAFNIQTTFLGKQNR